jgi:hypothetical protein
MHGAHSAPLYGGLAAQVSAPPTGEVRWDCQSHRIPVDLLHLYPHSRRRRGRHGQLLPRGPDGYNVIMAHELA